MLPEKQALLINKPEPLSYQFKSSITQRLPLHASKPTPKIYNATAVHYSHIANTHKKIFHTRLVHRRPNIRSHSVLFKIQSTSFRLTYDGINVGERGSGALRPSPESNIFPFKFILISEN